MSGGCEHLPGAAGAKTTQELPVEMSKPGRWPPLLAKRGQAFGIANLGWNRGNPVPIKGGVFCITCVYLQRKI